MIILNNLQGSPFMNVENEKETTFAYVQKEECIE